MNTHDFSKNPGRKKPWEEEKVAVLQAKFDLNYAIVTLGLLNWSFTLVELRWDLV